MGRLPRSARSLWIGAQLRVPPSIRRRVVPCLCDLKDFARLVAKPYLPVYEISGCVRSQPLSVIWVSAWPLPRHPLGRLFADEPAVRMVGQVPFWRLHEMADWPSGDIVIVHANKHAIRALPSGPAFVVTEYVQHTLDLSGDWEAVEARFHRSIRKKACQRIRRDGYEFTDRKSVV